MFKLHQLVMHLSQRFSLNKRDTLLILCSICTCPEVPILGEVTALVRRFPAALSRVASCGEIVARRVFPRMLLA